MKKNACDGVKFLTDKELISSWGWMQSICPADSPIYKTMTTELIKRGLKCPSTPIDFSKIVVKDYKNDYLFSYTRVDRKSQVPCC